MQSQTQPWIVAWFQRRNPDAPVDLRANFHEERLVDSFGIIELIGEIEASGCRGGTATASPRRADR